MALLQLLSLQIPGLKASEAVPGSEHRKVPTPTTREECHGGKEEGGTSGLNWDTSNFTSNPDTDIWGPMGL